MKTATAGQKVRLDQKCKPQSEEQILLTGQASICSSTQSLLFILPYMILNAIIFFLSFLLFILIVITLRSMFEKFFEED
ncbi:MAG: hypothetical protein JWR87_527 [Segetibacter sp.]|jgi:hypothetical protein|nr:hypothetical protein [Segetibacter sp.]